MEERREKCDVNNEFENAMILICLVESYFEWPTRFKDRIEIQFISYHEILVSFCV